MFSVESDVMLNASITVDLYVCVYRVTKSRGLVDLIVFDVMVCCRVCV